MSLVISKRLESIAAMVTPGKKVCDIGCDHGYLSIYLVLNNISPFVYASDVRKGPLDKAIENIALYGVKDKVVPVLSNGLEKFKAGDAESVVLAGMGGNLMIDILEKCMDVTVAFDEIILEPQSDPQRVRHFLEDKGFLIVSENFIKDEGKFYPVIKAVKGEMHYENEWEYIYGKILLSEENPTLHEFLLKERKLYSDILDRLFKEKQSEPVKRRIEEVKKDLFYNAKALEVLDSEKYLAEELEI